MSRHFMLNKAWNCERMVLYRRKMFVSHAFKRLKVVALFNVLGHFDFALVFFFIAWHYTDSCELSDTLIVKHLLGGFEHGWEGLSVRWGVALLCSRPLRCVARQGLGLCVHVRLKHGLWFRGDLVDAATLRLLANKSRAFVLLIRISVVFP